MSAGRLRGRVRIEAANLVDNGRGGRAAPAGRDAWRTVAESAPAEIIGLRGGEALQNAVLRSKQLWRVTIRARLGITAGMRVVWRDRDLGELVGNIRSITPNDSRDGLVMTVETGTAAS